MSPETAALEAQFFSCNVATFGSSKKPPQLERREVQKVRDGTTPAGFLFFSSTSSHQVCTRLSVLRF